MGAARVRVLSSMGVFRTDDGPAPQGCFTEATQPTGSWRKCAAKAGRLRCRPLLRPNPVPPRSACRLGNIFGPHEAVRETRQNLCLVSSHDSRRRGPPGVHHGRDARGRREMGMAARSCTRDRGMIRIPRPTAARSHAGYRPRRPPKRSMNLHVRIAGRSGHDDPPRPPPHVQRSAHDGQRPPTNARASEWTAMPYALRPDACRTGARNDPLPRHPCGSLARARAPGSGFIRG